SGAAGLAAGGGGAQPVGAGAGGDDVRVVGEPVHDRGAQPGVGEGGGPFGEDLEQQLGAAAVQLDVAELVQAQQVDPPVPADHLGQRLVIGGLGQLVAQRGGGDGTDTVPVLRGGGAQPDQQVRFPGPRIADQAQR